MSQHISTATDSNVQAHAQVPQFLSASGGTVLRRFLVAGGLWALLAGVLSLGTLAPLASGLPLPWATLGPGRLDAAYRTTALWGGVWLPLMAGLLWLLGLGGGAGRPARLASLGFWMWQAALLVGVVGILAGLGAPDTWSAIPNSAALILWMALATIAYAAWITGRHTPGLSLPGSLALVVLLALLTTQALALLGLVAGGAGQAIALSLVAHLQSTLCVPLAGLAVAAAVIPESTVRPLYSGRMLVIGCCLWLPLAVLASGQDLVPDLYPEALSRVAGASAALWLVPVTLALVAVLGTWIGRGPAQRHPAAFFLSLGLAGVFGAALARTGGILAGPEALAFTSFDPRHVLSPPLVVAGLVAVGAGYALLEVGEADWRPPWQLALQLVGGLMALLVLAMVAIAELAVGPAADLAYAELRLRLPGTMLSLLAVGLWLAVITTTPLRLNLGQRSDEDRGRILMPTAVAIATAGGLVASLFLSAFLPLADPATVMQSSLALARDLAAAPLRAAGRQQYVADGCVACHTQRVRQVPADAKLGPPLQRGDYGTGPALAGQRRMGPDLTWVGDRYQTPEALVNGMAVHGPSGTLALPWLVDHLGPTESGMALFDYLLSLRSGTSAVP